MDNEKAPKRSGTQDVDDESTRLFVKPKASSLSPQSAAATHIRRPLTTELPTEHSDETLLSALDDEATTTLSSTPAAFAVTTKASVQTRVNPNVHDDVSMHMKDGVKTEVISLESESSKETAVNVELHGALTQKSQPAPTNFSITAALFPETHPLREKYRGKQVLKGRFVLLETLGSGGMGYVYLAKDLLREEMEDQDSLIAIKVLNDDCRRLPGALQALQREAKKAQALSHPNIVTVYDFDRDGDTAFITMEYIEGESLKDHLRKQTRMPYEKALYVIERVARGLAYAHQQGFAHADIKPANIFLSANGTVKILDFGIAKAVSEATQEKRTLADSITDGALTPGYASLEMLQGKALTPSDDVYSLTCMYYEMLRGKHPFIGENGMPIPADVAFEQKVKLETISGIPRRQMKVLRKGLAFERAKRFKNAGEFVEAIKPRNLKKDVGLLLLAAMISGVGIWGFNAAKKQIVPPLSSLSVDLMEIAQNVTDADDLLRSPELTEEQKDNAVNQAYSMYTFSWEQINKLTSNPVEREKAQAILKDRMEKVSVYFINRSKASDLETFKLLELQIVLETLSQNELLSNQKKIEAAKADISRRIERLNKQK